MVNGYRKSVWAGALIFSMQCVYIYICITFTENADVSFVVCDIHMCSACHSFSSAQNKVKLHVEDVKGTANKT